MISAKKWHELRERMAALAIDETQLLERFLTGGGRGGQKINKTATCVSLKHLPTGTVIKCQKTRSREDNRFFARRLLCEQLEKDLGKESAEVNKLRKQKKRRQRRHRHC